MSAETVAGSGPTCAILWKIFRLDEAETPQAMNLPGYRLHPLKGELTGFWSVTVRANWRIIFRLDGTDVCGVELTDYH